MPRTRALSADADTVFEIAADLGNMSWLPPGVETELPGPRLLRMWFRDTDIEVPFTIDWERLRVEWGAEDGADHSGWFRVSRLGENACVVSVRLHGPPGVPRSRVDAWTDDALTALVSEVCTERART